MIDAGLKRLNKNITGRILSVLFLIFFIFEAYIWIATGGFPAMRDQWEGHYSHLPARNYVKHGITNLKFLDDYATSSAKEAHPYYYTHQPSFPTFVSYALQKMGTESLPQETFIMIFILGIGLYYMYLTAKEYTENDYAALIILALSIFNYQDVLIFGSHLFRGWTWILHFGILYNLKKYSAQRVKYYLYIGLVFYFMITYFALMHMIYISLLVLMLKTFGFYDKLSWKHIFAFILAGTLPAFLLHKTIVMRALGFDLFIEDIRLAFSKRIFVSITSYDVEGFFDQNSIVHWSSPMDKHNMDNYFSFIKQVYSVICRRYGFFFISLITIFFPLCAARKLVDISNASSSNSNPFSCYIDRLLNAMQIKSKDASFFLAFSSATIIICLVFRSYIGIMYSYAMPFFIVPISMCGAIVLSAITRNLFIKPSRKTAKMVSYFSLTIIILGLIKADYDHLAKELPIESLYGHEVLHKYEGHSFTTNTHTPYVNYFTGEWVTMYLGKTLNRFIKNPRSKPAYNFERDKLTNKQKYENPEFLFVANLLAYKNHDEILKKYPLVEKGDHYWIFDLRGRIN